MKERNQDCYLFSNWLAGWRAYAWRARNNLFTNNYNAEIEIVDSTKPSNTILSMYTTKHLLLLIHSF